MLIELWNLECDRSDESEVQRHHFLARIQYNSCTIFVLQFLPDKGS